MFAETPAKVTTLQNEITSQPEVDTPNRQRILKELIQIINTTEPHGPFGQFLEVPESTPDTRHQRLRSHLSLEGKQFAKTVFQNLETFLSEHHADINNPPFTVEEIQGALRELLNMNFDGAEVDRRALFLIVSSVRCRLLRVQRQLAREQADPQLEVARNELPLNESIYIGIKDGRLTTKEQRDSVFDVISETVETYQEQIDHLSDPTFQELVELSAPINIPELFSHIQDQTKTLGVKHMEALLVQSRELSWRRSDDLGSLYHRRDTFGFIVLEKLIAYARNVPPNLTVYTDLAQPSFLSTPPETLEASQPETKKRRLGIPRRLRRALIIGLLSLADVAAILTAPYAIAVGQAVTGQTEAHAPDLDEDLREEMLNGANTISTTPWWLTGNNEESEIVVTDESTPTLELTSTEESPTETVVTATTQATTGTINTATPESIVPTTTLTPSPTPDTLMNVSNVIQEEQSDPTATLPPTETASATLTSTLPSTATETFPTPTPTLTETPAPSEEVEPITNPVEYFLGGEFDAVKTQLRETRLGFQQLESAPAGFIEVTQDNISFYVPENLEPRFYYLYSPLTVARSLGAFDVPEADRAAFLESRINDHQLTFLIAGLDYRPEYAGGSAGFIGRSDAPMIVSIDIQTGELTVVSIARDTWSPEVAREFGNSRANSEISVMSWVHANENGQLVATDPAFSRYIAENICGCMIDGVLQFNFQSIAEYIDMLYPNGMTITVPETINDTSFGFYIEAGERTINGETAVNYMRTRYASAGGDESRQGRQRLILETLLRGMAREIKNNPLNAPNIISDFLGATEDAFARFDAQRQLVDSNDPSENTNAGMMRSFGITPFQVVAHMNNIMGTITSPEAVGSLVSTFTQGTGQEMIEIYGEGGGITMIQIDGNNTNSASYSSDRNYWQPARQLIGEALGFEVIPG